MTFFLTRHIDSIIQIVLGAFLSWMAFRPANKLDGRTTKILAVCGPALILIGGLFLLKPDAPLEWRRQFTADKIASAEFPGPPRANESTDTLGGVSVKRVSFTYDVPGKDIALFLSYSALPDNARAMTDSQRIDATVAYLTSQGSKVTRNEKDATAPIYRLTLRQEEKKATVRMALAYVGDNVYRVVASQTDGQEGSAVIDRFLSSFRLSNSP